MNKIWQKLSLVVLVSIIAIPALLFFFLQEKNAQTNLSRTEIYGVEYLARVVDIHARVVEFRGALAAYNTKGVGRKSKLSQMVSDIDVGFNQLGEIDGRYGEVLSSTTRFTGLKKSWESAKRIYLADNREAVPHVDTVLEEVVGIIKHVGDSSSIVLDSNLDSNYLAESVVDVVPNAVANTLLLRDSFTTSGPLARTAALKLSSARSQVRGDLDKIQRGMDVAIRHNPELGTQVTPLVSVVKEVGDIYLDNIARELSSTSRKGGLPTTQLYEDGNLMIASLFKFSAASIAELKSILESRLKAQNRLKYTVIGLALVTLAAAMALLAMVTRGITRQVGSISGAFDQIRKGDLNARAQVVSHDELGRLASSLNVMLAETISLTQSREERDKIQRSIRKLLEEVSEVASGDLTIEAEVTDNMTGAIADAFNHMVHELRRIIGDVQKATYQLSASSSAVRQTMDTLAEGSEEQSGEIIETSQAMDSMALSIKQVSDNAAVSAKVAEQALWTSKSGTDTVNKTIDAMEVIKGHVSETAKRIKRLGESSQEIGDSVRLIKDIADRTSILALNASIQAATAGDAGKGFSVVAEEIERLADTVAGVTKRVSTMISTIQMETSEAVLAMEETVEEVTNGSELANEAGKVLVEIEEVSKKLAELIGAISTAAQQQAESSETVAGSMSDITEITKRATAGTRNVAGEIENLAMLAGELRSSVSKFKLPEDLILTPEAEVLADISPIGHGNGEAEDIELLSEEIPESFRAKSS